MDYAGEGRITDCGGYVRVDSGSGNSSELSAVYRAFASFCLDNKVTRAQIAPEFKLPAS